MSSRARRLVERLSARRCESPESYERGLDLIQASPEWEELTSPALRAELVELVADLGDTSRMNAFARTFYERALAESERRSGS